MQITRERYLDDTSRYHVELSLATRRSEMHSLLTDVPAEVQQQIGDALVRCLDEIQRLLAPFVAQAAARRGGSPFGCGT
jgi:hypothetical protein